MFYIKLGSTIRQGRVERVQYRVRPRRPRPPAAGAPRDDSSSDESDGEQLGARPSSPIPGVNIPNFSSESAQKYNERFNTNDNRWYQYRTVQQTRRDNLVEIAMRTVMLMRQNRQLQEKLAILKADTKMYMEYMRNNPIDHIANVENHPEGGNKIEPNIEEVLKTRR